ncbi:MAG TPA: nuclear transport factor 2 family protein [Gaiellaceae bacterium]|nr:nuclear transport factor 2 family protein [Gaiellaceae bacterium]
MSELRAAGEALLRAIEARDYAAVAGCFAEDASFRVLTPGPLREHTGPQEAAERYRFWLEPLEGFEVLESDVEEIADRVRVRYRFRGRDPEKGWQVNEHTGYAAVRDSRIRALVLTCTGFRPAPEP